jgi:ribose transport system substrate-binding protein
MANEARFRTVAEGKAPVAEGEQRAERPWRLAVVVKNTTNAAYRSALKAGEDAGQRYGLEILPLAPQQPDDLAEQNALLADLIEHRRVDGIVVTPVNAQAQATLVEQANQAGIPIFNFSNLLGGGEIVTFVGSDDVAVGRQMVEWLAQTTGGRAQALLVDGIPGTPTAVQRRQGIEEALAGQPGIQVLASQPGYYDRTRAAAVAADLLAAHPSADTLLALNDEMALGALDTLAATGRAEALRVVGVNGTPDGLRAIENGALAATVDYALYPMVRRSVELAVRFLNGERLTLSEQRVLLPTAVIDRTNIQAAIAERQAWGLM